MIPNYKYSKTIGRDTGKHDEIAGNNEYSYLARARITRRLHSPVSLAPS